MYVINWNFWLHFNWYTGYVLCMYFFKKNLKIWKYVFKFVSEVARFSELINLAIFPNDNSYKDKRLKKYFVCLSHRLSSFYNIVHSSSLASASGHKKWIIEFIWNSYISDEKSLSFEEKHWGVQLSYKY